MCSYSRVSSRAYESQLRGEREEFEVFRYYEDRSYFIILYFLYLPMEIYFNILVTKDFGTEYSLLYLLLLL